MPDERSTSEITITPILTDHIRPNNWNPNRMSEMEFAAYVADVRTRGRLPKPIVVRPLGDDRYEIVDGEHGWRAAQEVGLTKVSCEIVNCDDFTAMKETFQRNQHGEHDPLLEGKMFASMMESKGLSERKLAKQLGIAPNTVGNRLKYVEALQHRETWAAAVGVRKPCAPDDHQAKIGNLSLPQVELYLDLPIDFANDWVDAGANMHLMDKSYPFNENFWTTKDLIDMAWDHGIVEFVDANMTSEEAFLRVAKIALWSSEHSELEGTEHIRAVARLGLSATVLDHLPCGCLDGDKSRAILSAEEWESILSKSSNAATDARELHAMIADGVAEALRAAGKDPQAFQSPSDVKAAAALGDAPAFIRDAECLSTGERLALWRAGGDNPDDLVAKAQKMAIEAFRQRRDGQQASGHKGIRVDGKTIDDVYRAYRHNLLQEEEIAAEDAMFADRSSLIEEVLATLGHDPAIRSACVQARPAREVLSEQLQALNPPMLALLAAAILGKYSTVATPAERWFQAMSTAEVSDTIACEPA